MLPSVSPSPWFDAADHSGEGAAVDKRHGNLKGVSSVDDHVNDICSWKEEDTSNRLGSSNDSSAPHGTNSPNSSSHRQEASDEAWGVAGLESGQESKLKSAETPSSPISSVEITKLECLEATDPLVVEGNRKQSIQDVELLHPYVPPLPSVTTSTAPLTAPPFSFALSSDARGQAMLTDDEALALNKKLEELGLSSWWSIQLISSICSADHYLSAHATCAARNGSHSRRRSKESRRSSASRLSKKARLFGKRQSVLLDAPSTEATGAPCSQSGRSRAGGVSSRHHSQALWSLSTHGHYSSKLERGGNANLSRLPEWARSFHGVLLEFTKTDESLPFLEEFSHNDSRFSSIYEAIQPALTPIGFNTVLGKLESNGYRTPLEVFNDIYGILLAAYRSNPPGSPLWLQAHEASQLFRTMILKVHPTLSDDFTPTPSPTPAIETAPPRRNVSSAVQRAVSEDQDPAAVDLWLREFLSLDDAPAEDGSGGARRAATSPSAAAAQSSRKRPAKRSNGATRNTSAVHYPNARGLSGEASATRSSSRGGSKGRLGIGAAARYRTAAAAQPPITEEERQEFQNYLSQLKPTHHLMLFEAFRRTAIWRCIESGEVELDDARTLPVVFRKMISWCKSQVAVQLPAKFPHVGPAPEASALSSRESLTSLPPEHRPTGKTVPWPTTTSEDVSESRGGPPDPNYFGGSDSKYSPLGPGETSPKSGSSSSSGSSSTSSCSSSSCSSSISSGSSSASSNSDGESGGDDDDGGALATATQSVPQSHDDGCCGLS